MTRLRLLSMTHPALAGQREAKRLALLPEIEVTALEANEFRSETPPPTVRRVSVPTRGRGWSARLPSLAAAVTLLDPDVIHLQADPATRLAIDVSQLCARSARGLVLEVGSTAAWPAGRSRNLLAAWRARRTLLRAGAVVAPNTRTLAAMRRLGFAGTGVVAGQGQEPEQAPERAAARRALHLPSESCPVFGWAGRLDPQSGIFELLDAAAACEVDVVLAIPGGNPAQTDILDRADALEILHRVRFVAPEPGRTGLPSDPDLAFYPGILGAADALIVAPPAGEADLARYERCIERAQAHAVPIVYADRPDLAETVGPGGWPIDATDPALLATLLGEIGADRALLAARAREAAAHAAQRHSPEAAAAELAFAIRAANRRRCAARIKPGPAPARDFLGLAEREPSRT